MHTIFSDCSSGSLPLAFVLCGCSLQRAGHL